MSLAKAASASPILGDCGLGIEFKGDSDGSEEDWEGQARMTLGSAYHRTTSLDEESMEGDLSDESNDENGSSFYGASVFLASSSLCHTEWIKEVQLTLERAVRDNHTVEIAGLELNTLKMAFNITFHDLRAVSLPFLMQQIKLATAAASSKQVSGLIYTLINSILNLNT